MFEFNISVIFFPKEKITDRMSARKRKKRMRQRTIGEEKEWKWTIECSICWIVRNKTGRGKFKCKIEKNN